MARLRPPYLRQKLRLYADENFPLAVVEAVRADPFWRRRVSIRTAAELGNASRDDGFHASYCRKHGLVLVTLDEDFMDDRRFPFGQGIAGMICIVSRTPEEIMTSLVAILSFLTDMPLPQHFAGDSKFQVSGEGAVMRGRDAETREVKTMQLVPGTGAEEVAKHFSYFQPP